MMLKKIFFPALVALLVISATVSCYAIVKNLEQEKQSLIKVGESITIPEGSVVKTAVDVGGSITIYGKVEEDVVCVGGSVFLKDSAMVGGNVVSVGGKIMKEPGAILKGDVVEISIPAVSPFVCFFTKDGFLTGIAIFQLLNFIGFVILTVILVAIFTKQLGKVSSKIEKDVLVSFLVGTLLLVLFVPIIIVLFISLVGMVLVPVWIVLAISAGIFGYTAAAHLLGKKTFHAFRLKGLSMMTETLLGVLLLSLVGFIPIAGFLVKLIATLCGLGAVYTTRFGTK